MKNLFTALSIILVITGGFSQNEKSEQADKLFQSYQYVDAIDAYLKLVKNNEADTYVYNQLADSYYYVFNMDEAVKWYAKAIKNTQNAETYYRYAQALRTQGAYEEANKQMAVFAQQNPTDPRAIAYLENPNNTPKLADSSKLFEVTETTVNSPNQTDFGPVLSNTNILYFTSTRNTRKKEDQWTNTPYLDMYQSQRDANGQWSEPEPVNALNTPYHDGPLTISEDGTVMIFSRDGHSEKSFKKLENKNIKLAQQGLYKATLVNGKWTNIEALPFNSNDYSVTHPSLSSDGKTLYFASNMPGGLGDTDIWKVSINGNNYGEPINLGKQVNTAGKEGFPFISNNHILYFASSGRAGYGGLDVFKTDLNTTEKAVNLGTGINTEKDDFSFSFNTKYHVGFLASNRSGVDNIYMATPICQFKTIVMVTDATTNQPIKGAVVSVLDRQQNTIAKQKTKAKGEIDFDVTCNPDYIINVAKAKYNTASVQVGTPENNKTVVQVALMPISTLITDTEVKLNNIFFEFDKSNITQQGALELNKLVAVMKDYPDMQILIRSHTDSKGNADYNLKLSDRRAQATMQYVISKGINKDRLAAVGLGSSEPKVNCAPNCTDVEDAQNRRSEFLIVKK
ncbi:OmpA family protein [Bizionia sediminis]|uniref:OmpA family protein n=1 Tax=Bizionia sediminis TaxID=1737064 RepID=A0ABW5KV88_9FLAO